MICEQSLFLIFLLCLDPVVIYSKVCLTFSKGFSYFYLQDKEDGKIKEIKSQKLPGLAKWFPTQNPCALSPLQTSYWQIQVRTPSNWQASFRTKSAKYNCLDPDAEEALIYGLLKPLEVSNERLCHWKEAEMAKARSI